MTLPISPGVKPDTVKDEPPRPRWARAGVGRTWASPAEGCPRNSVVMSDPLERFPYGNPERASLALLKFLAAPPLTGS
jgi:hypothetical protein